MRHGILTRSGTDRFAPPGISIRVPMRYLSRENSLCQAADLVLEDRTGKEALGCPGGRGGLFTLSSSRRDHRAGTLRDRGEEMVPRDEECYYCDIPVLWFI